MKNRQIKSDPEHFEKNCEIWKKNVRSKLSRTAGKSYISVIDAALSIFIIALLRILLYACFNNYVKKVCLKRITPVSLLLLSCRLDRDEVLSSTDVTQSANCRRGECRWSSAMKCNQISPRIHSVQCAVESVKCKV